jgi:hypothetical protein
MSSKISWQTVEEATTKCRMETSLLLKWAEQGVIRAKQVGTRSMRVSADDLEVKMRAITGIRVAL